MEKENTSVFSKEKQRKTCSSLCTGDATEDMVNTLDSGKDEDQDHEEIYKMANVMSECEGLTVMLQRSESDVMQSRQIISKNKRNEKSVSLELLSELQAAKWLNSGVPPFLCSLLSKFSGAWNFHSVDKLMKCRCLHLQTRCSERLGVGEAADVGSAEAVFLLRQSEVEQTAVDPDGNEHHQHHAWSSQPGEEVFCCRELVMASKLSHRVWMKTCSKQL